MTSPLPFADHVSMAVVLERERLLREYRTRVLTRQENMRLVSLMRCAHEPIYQTTPETAA